MFAWRLHLGACTQATMKKCMRGLRLPVPAGRRLHTQRAPPPCPSSVASAAADPRWITRLNESLSTHPLETAAAYMTLDILSVMSLYTLVTSHLVIPVDFTLAFGIARVLRRFRLPLDLVMAGLLARAMPSLRRVRIAAALAHAGAAAAGSIASVVGGGRAASLLHGRGGGALFAAAGRLVDSYGLALLVSQRMVMGLLSVGSVYALLRLGVDVQGALESVLSSAPPIPAGGIIGGSSSGIDSAAPQLAAGGDGGSSGDGAACRTASSSGGAASSTLASAVSAVSATAGPWAAAVCAGAALYPGVLLGSAALGSRIGRWRAAAATTAR